MVFKKKARRMYRGFKKSARRSHSSSGMSPMNVLLAGAIVGAARPYAANVLPNLFSAGPVDSDNVIIGAASFYGMKKTSGLMKAISTVALAQEAAIVASRLTSPQTSTKSNDDSVQSN
jgi:hypothetical protein